MNQFTIYSILHFIVRSDEGPVLAVRCSINLCVLPASPENGGRAHEGKLEDVNEAPFYHALIFCVALFI